MFEMNATMQMWIFSQESGFRFFYNETKSQHFVKPDSYVALNQNKSVNAAINIFVVIYCLKWLKIAEVEII